MSSQITSTNNNIAKQMKSIPIRRLQVHGIEVPETSLKIKTTSFTVLSFRGDFKPWGAIYPQHVRTQVLCKDGISISLLEDDYKKSLPKGAVLKKLERYAFLFNTIRDCYLLDTTTDKDVKHTILPSGDCELEKLPQWDENFLVTLSSMAVASLNYTNDFLPRVVREIGEIHDFSMLIYHALVSPRNKYIDELFEIDKDAVAVFEECTNMAKRSKTTVTITEELIRFEQNGLYFPSSSNHIIYDLPVANPTLKAINRDRALFADNAFNYSNQKNDDEALENLKAYRDSQGLSTEELYRLVKKLFKN
ncbi:MAG: 35 kDa unknown protein [Tomato associated bunya-like virus 1]|nr:MAG: 35 kDa unknown protein [Tomato associated bunya-like virus 1]